MTVCGLGFESLKATSSWAGLEEKAHDNPPCYLLLGMGPLLVLWLRESRGFNDLSSTSLKMARLERGQDRRNPSENISYAHGKCGCGSGAVLPGS